ncbi:MAG: hypothetical protein CVU47_01380 [Chloroflexi bacterium HGW-Chloroflexi-9]|nr:MAG: hypothetical protein CVU47_01380 [Chloroflexi bacterium HGW-Chloroflexi-9]
MHPPAAPARGLRYARDVRRASRSPEASSIAAPVGVGFFLLLLYWWTVAPSISALHDNVDSAELVTVASVTGIAHPPGSAIWVPLGRAALDLLGFIEEPALRTNLLSVVCMALAGALIAVAARRWMPGTPAWACALAGLLAGLAPIPWAQALVTEVLALQALLTALALVLAVDAARGRAWAPFALTLGLLAWNHPTGLAVALPLGIACLVLAHPRARTLGVPLALFLLPGVYTVAYLLIRADAPLAWGDTSTLRGVWDHLSGAIYRDVIDRNHSTVLQSVPETLRRTLRQVPPLAWPLLPVGALAVGRSRPALAASLGVSVVLLGLFVSAYRATGRQDYLTTVAFAGALLVAWGLPLTLDWARRLLPQPPPPFTTSAIAVGLLALWLVVNGDEVSRRGDTALRDEAVAILAAAEPDAVIETDRDEQTFPLWYARVVLGERPDVTVIDTRGLAPVVPPRP